MLKRKTSRSGDTVKLSFVLEDGDPRLPASVVGDFNAWDETVHPFRRRSNGTWSVVVELAAGTRHAFRYRSADGSWFDEPEADGTERGGMGADNCIVCT